VFGQGSGSMAIKDVLLIGNPVLRKISDPVADFDGELHEIMVDLKDTLTHLQEKMKIGRALAAPQVGCLKQVIYFQLPGQSFYLINPKILWKSKDTFDVWDSCFCFKVSFFVNIERYRKIRVQFTDENRESHVKGYSDDLSELFQHEIDHLYGVLATDHLKDNTKLIMREEWDRLYM
jgi:peptide deformylase